MDDQAAAWKKFKEAFTRITADIKATIAGAFVQDTTQQQDNSLRLIVTLGEVKIKNQTLPTPPGLP